MPFKNPHPLYSIWQGMRRRCLTPTTKQFSDYGGRGIKICKRWDDFHAFADDMGARPKGYSLDRIDNDGDYEPDNCRWASRKEQQLNQRRAVYVTIGCETYRAIELAEKIGVKTETIVNRAKRGLPIDKVLSQDRLTNTDGLALGGKANGLRQKAKTHCPKGHEYTPKNLLKSKAGFRRCKICHRERERVRRIGKRTP